MSGEKLQCLLELYPEPFDHLRGLVQLLLDQFAFEIKSPAAGLVLDVIAGGFAVVNLFARYKRTSRSRRCFLYFRLWLTSSAFHRQTKRQ
jgi:hypothetical protein